MAVALKSYALCLPRANSTDSFNRRCSKWRSPRAAVIPNVHLPTLSSEVMAYIAKVPTDFLRLGNIVSGRNQYGLPTCKHRSVRMSLSTTAASERLKPSDITVMVNSCTGKMGQAVIKAADSAGLHIVPESFGKTEEAGQVVDICGKKIQVHGLAEREEVIASVFNKHPNLIVVDYMVPATVNENAEIYSKIGVPFVMGTTGGDRDRLLKAVEDSKVYAVISPQMGKQVVAFLAAMEIMAKQFPGAFSGYSLQVTESHQASKVDISGTAKAVISCFEKLGVSYDMEQIQLVRDPEQQIEMMGVPEEYLAGHAFHTYKLRSPDETVSFEFQHNVCGRSIYAEGTVDAVLFLANQIKSLADKRIYNMIDVLQEGNMR